MKKITLMVVAVFLIAASTAVAGGGQEEPATGGKIMPTPPGQLPIVNEKVTLTAFAATRPWSDDYSYEGNTFSKLLEDTTNVHVEFTVAPSQEASTKINLLMASGDYPMVIFSSGWGMSEVALYGQQGTLLALEDLIDKYTIHAKRMFVEYPYLRAQAEIDGHIYNFSEINECYHCSVSRKMWVNKTWLDRLGLAMPTTTEEFYDMLVAFKTQDPNNNGKADEIPLAGGYKGVWNGTLDHFLMNAFLQYNPDRMSVIDGTLQVAFDKPGWKEGLKYIARLYEAGLIAPETFTMDRNQLKALGENPGIEILGAVPCGAPHLFTEIKGERYKMFASLPPIAGPSGERHASFNLPIRWNVKATITDKTTLPEVAVRWLDNFYEEKWILEQIWGREGSEWRWAKPGEIGLNGKPAIYTTMISWGEQKPNTTWNQIAPTYRTAAHRLGQTSTDEWDLEVILYEGSAPYYDYAPPVDEVVPPLVIPTDVASEYNELRTVLWSYVDEMFARFVTGDVDIDSGWDGYVRELKNIGLDKFLEIAQAAYDSKYK